MAPLVFATRRRVEHTSCVVPTRSVTPRVPFNRRCFAPGVVLLAVRMGIARRNCAIYFALGGGYKRLLSLKRDDHARAKVTLGFSLERQQRQKVLIYSTVV